LADPCGAFVFAAHEGAVAAESKETSAQMTIPRLRFPQAIVISLAISDLNEGPLPFKRHAARNASTEHNEGALSPDLPFLLKGLSINAQIKMVSGNRENASRADSQLFVSMREGSSYYGSSRDILSAGP